MAIADWTIVDGPVAEVGADELEALFLLGHVDPAEAEKLFRQHADDWDLYAQIDPRDIEHRYVIEAGAGEKVRVVEVASDHPNAVPVTWVHVS